MSYMNRFIAPNPSVSFLPVSTCPQISRYSFVGPFSCVIGNVVIGRNVFIGCSVTVRADEGSPFFIGDNTNLQDGVILHGLAKDKVFVNGREYSIYIDEEVSCAHGSMVHGPVRIGRRCFIGFNAIIFNAVLEEGCFVEAGAIVTNGVRVPPNRLVPTGAIIDNQCKANALECVPMELVEFARGVVEVNVELARNYKYVDPCECPRDC